MVRCSITGWILADKAARSLENAGAVLHALSNAADFGGAAAGLP